MKKYDLQKKFPLTISCQQEIKVLYSLLQKTHAQKKYFRTRVCPTLIQTTLDSNFQDELQKKKSKANIRLGSKDKKLFSSTSTVKNLQSLIDKHIFFWVMKRPLGVVMLKGRKVSTIVISNKDQCM